MEPTSVFDCVHIFFVATIGCRLLRRFLRIENCQDPLIFAIFFGGAIGKCIGGSNTTLQEPAGCNGDHWMC